MNHFKTFLLQKGATQYTIQRKTKAVHLYLQWLDQQHIDLSISTYNDLIAFIEHWQNQNKTVHQINRCLQAISDYYQCMEIDDIAYRVRIRGTTQKVPGPQLNAQQLDDIYQAFTPASSHGYYHFSDKIIVGLMIYQALELQNIFHLRLCHLDFNKSTLYVPAHSHRMARSIPLQAHQILPLHQYVQQRQSIIDQWLFTKSYLAQHEKSISDKLFSPQCERYQRLHIQYKKLSKQVKKIALTALDINLLKLSQLRQSRITLWIDQYGLRKTQYLAGLRSVTSIERYKQHNFEDLKAQIKKHHPLK